jgi:hypothetical protein
MNQYIYAWKCHKETPCVGILNKQKCLFFLFFMYKIGEQECGTDSAPRGWGGWYWWEEGRDGEMV